MRGPLEGETDFSFLRACGSWKVGDMCGGRLFCVSVADVFAAGMAAWAACRLRLWGVGKEVAYGLSVEHVRNRLL